MRNQNEPGLHLRLPSSGYVLKKRDLSRFLTEIMTRLQFAKDRYKHWSVKPEILLVELVDTHQMNMAELVLAKMVNKSGVITFEALNLTIW